VQVFIVCQKLPEGQEPIVYQDQAQALEAFKSMGGEVAFYPVEMEIKL
jgi:hypothetical protein